MKKIKIILFILMFFIFSNFEAYAHDVYRGYIYDSENNAVPSPNIYNFQKIISGASLQTGAFLNPQDIFIDEKNNIYVLDTGNNRIVKMDSDFNLVKVFDSFSSETLNKPEGIYVDENEKMYIADTENHRIVIAGSDSSLIGIIQNPQSELFDEDFVFTPKKIVVDSAGTVFVLAKDVFQGLMSFDKEGTFLSFYGGNRVEMTVQLAIERMWRKILSKDQINAGQRYVPIGYANIFIDKEDFVFACDKSQDGQIKQLNPLGVDVLSKANQGALKFGDYGYETVNNASVNTVFVDINVDEDANINCLDMTRGRVFRYSSEGNLLGVFGCIGTQDGSFSLPTAIESFKDYILVLDGTRNDITVFTKSEYGKMLDTAVNYYNDGLYEESKEYWQEVLKRNSNFELVYKGMGKAEYKLGNYRGAMKNYSLCDDSEGYAEAFTAYRNAIIREHFAVIVLVVIIIIAAVYMTVRIFRKRKRRSVNERGA
ncbi:MAG: hypothetical protein ACI4F7_03045 [Acutalibacteraceae bacterium]